MSRCGVFRVDPTWDQGSKSELDRRLDRAMAESPGEDLVHVRAKVWFKFLEERRVQSHERGMTHLFSSVLFNQWITLDRILPFEEVVAIQVEVNGERPREASTP